MKRTQVPICNIPGNNANDKNMNFILFDYIDIIKEAGYRYMPHPPLKNININIDFKMSSV